MVREPLGRSDGAESVRSSILFRETETRLDSRFFAPTDFLLHRKIQSFLVDYSAEHKNVHSGGALCLGAAAAAGLHSTSTIRKRSVLLRARERGRWFLCLRPRLVWR